MRLIQTLVSSSFALLIAAVSAVSSATPNFPSVIQSELSLAYTPSCTLCHAGAPGKGTVTQPFGVSLRARGLVPGDGDSLSSALDALEGEGKDSNCDGTPDIAELKDGLDPNTGEDLAGTGRPTPPETSCGDAPEIPTYGCGAQIVASPATAPASAAALVTLLALALLRRRK